MILCTTSASAKGWMESPGMTWQELPGTSEQVLQSCKMHQNATPHTAALWHSMWFDYLQTQTVARASAIPVCNSHPTICLAVSIKKALILRLGSEKWIIHYHSLSFTIILTANISVCQVFFDGTTRCLCNFERSPGRCEADGLLLLVMAPFRT